MGILLGVGCSKPTGEGELLSIVHGTIGGEEMGLTDGRATGKK
jgi:hypothetical protein